MNFSNCGKRKYLSENFAVGNGIEIGPLHSAWPVPTQANVKYIDRYTREELRKQYPELDPYAIADTDIIDDGRYLKFINDDSQDFLLNSHVLEHSDDPIWTIYSWLRVVRPGGYILCAVPDKNFTFDKDRELTPFIDLWHQYTGLPGFKEKALNSFYSKVEKLSGDALQNAVQNALQKDLHVHFPVWDANSFCGFLSELSGALPIKFTVESFIRNGFEFLCALRKVES